MHDLALGVLHSALRGLAARQRVLADNVANVETPMFLAGRVDFESSLREAIDDGNPSAARITDSRSLAPTNPNGNNVNLDEEMISLVDTELRYQLAVEGVNAKYRVLRTSIGTR